MLHELHIRNFAIIDDLTLKLGDGFIVLTGETGAGKSILIDAAELVLGGRADSTVVRADEAGAWIEAHFRLDPEAQGQLLPRLEQEGLLDEDASHLTLAREVRREGRNLCRVNGRTVNLNLLRDLGEGLVDVHGQSEHLSLLRVREHLELLDRFAHHEGLRTEFSAGYRALTEVGQSLAKLRQMQSEAARRAEFLSFQINEIESARVQPGEEERLLEERTRLANAEQLALSAEQAISLLDEGADERPPVVDQLGEVTEALQSLARVDTTLTAVHLEVQSMLEQAGDLAKRLRVYRESIEFNPRRLDEVEERLALLRNLKRKYGDNLQAVLEHAEAAREELETLTNAEQRMAELEAQQEQLLSALGTVGAQLSEGRLRAGEALAVGIEQELMDLRMAGARFGVEMRQEPDPEGVYVGEKRLAYHENGVDEAEFLIEPNPGEGLKPLAKIASGGETSRLMLGLKSVLARADRTPTLIFDEIDQGIGGRVGGIVGLKLWRLARDHQVLCVTHLPQLAAFADQHFRVEKVQRAGRTFTTVGPLTADERLAELAMMLGGPGEANIRSASELMAQAAREKQSGSTG
jgi:DNA repair protein RecN (Recombination protein N)